MSKQWVNEVKKMNNKKLIKEIYNSMDKMYYKDLLMLEMLIRILKEKKQ